jgi:hypothetical protein
VLPEKAPHRIVYFTGVALVGVVLFAAGQSWALGAIAAGAFGGFAEAVRMARRQSA